MMTLDIFRKPDRKWESFLGVYPSALIDTHPSGEYVAMQVVQTDEEVTRERAAIWNAVSRKLFVIPENANALCWIERGTEVLILEEFYRDVNTRPPQYATPIQSEYRHFSRRLSWPAMDTIEKIELKFPMGWLIDIIPSPLEKIACFVWQDQCEAGIEYVSWEDGHLEQLDSIGFTTDSNLIRGPVFNEESTFIAMTFGNGCWWSESPDIPSPGGQFCAGYLIWSEAKSGKYQRLDINIDLPADWKPEDPEDIINNEFLGKPVFINSNEVKILLPTKEERIILLHI